MPFTCTGRPVRWMLIHRLNGLVVHLQRAKLCALGFNDTSIDTNELGGGEPIAHIPYPLNWTVVALLAAGITTHRFQQSFASFFSIALPIKSFGIFKPPL